MAGDDLVARSLAHVWHPCTQLKDHEGEDAAIPLIPVARAEGVWIEDTDGRRYIDAVSSWWTNIFGHRHPHIVERLKTQLDTLDHVMLAGFTHAPAVELAERLARITPGKLSRCMYADNGSSAVEVALKMSHHYWRNQGQPGKTRYIALSGSYHGETMGALAVSGSGMYRDAYAPLLMKPLMVRSPDCALMHDGHGRALGESWEDYSRRAFAQMEEMLARHGHETAAVIVEPLVQCAGGMRMYHPIYLKLLREACDRHGVHFIADEIAVGFGRTGRLFACEWAGVAPDMICLSKGLTGGTLPLAATLTTEAIYQAFHGDYREGRAFLHSHSYTGNPLACTAALATLDILEQRDWMAHNRGVGHLMYTAVQELMDHPHVAEVRQQGMILAIDLAQDGRGLKPFAAEERRGLHVYRHGLKAARSQTGVGAILRPLGNTVYFMPPYVIEPEEIGHLARLAIAGIHSATAD
jgi:adenosylmethionine-8-amino-7-oxononanoate aminotransferase